MMILMCLISVAVIAFFVMDRMGKINRRTAGTAVIYLMGIFLPSLLITISALSLYEGQRITDFISNNDVVVSGEYILSQAFGLMGQALCAVPAVLLSAIGCLLIVFQKKKEKDTAFGISQDELPVEMISASRWFAAAGTVMALAFIVFFCIIAVYAFSTLSVGFIYMLMITIVLGMVTFGIGFVVMAVIFPFVILSIGIQAALSCLPFIGAAAVSGTAFCIIHFLTIIISISALKRLNGESAVSKKTVVKYSLLSAVPVVNIFTASRLKNIAEKGSALC